MPHGDDVVGADEDVGLAVADLPGLQMRRAGDHVELVTVDIELRELAAIERVFDCQGMKIEMVLQDAQFVLVRIEQSDPGELAFRQDQTLWRIEVDPSEPPSVAVDIGCNHTHLAPGGYPLESMHCESGATITA